MLKAQKSKEAKKIQEQIKEQFGSNEGIEGIFFMNEKQKVYLVNREYAELETNNIKIDTLGLYVGSWMKDGFRLSIEGAQIIAKTATKNLIELDRENWEEWVKGIDITIETENGFYLVMYKGNCYGCTKVKDKKLFNYVPKARRLITINY